MKASSGTWALLVGAGVSACAAAAQLQTGAATARADAAVVSVTGGRVSGVVDGPVVVYRGIPFAAPPVGALRWRPPQPVRSWPDVLKAAAFKPDCAQAPFPGDAAPLGVDPAEDCLGINVWKPVGAGMARPAPVLVWIYGGGFVNGGSSPQVYDGRAFARDGVILVSFNYRVGRFGFFAHPALTVEARAHGDPVANYGYMDQLAALQWVKANIAAFGGDPDNVTLFGESAGGSSVLQWLVSPVARGLFQRAVVMSGGGRGRLLPARELDRPNAQGMPSAEASGVAFARTHGIHGEDAQALAALRALPAAQVVDGLNLGTLAAAADTYAGGPIHDGRLVADDPAQALRSGRWNRVPVLIGSDSDDLGLSAARDKAGVFALFGAQAGRARALYDRDGNGTFAAVAWQAGMDRMMGEPARFVADAVAGQGVASWLYRFDYVASALRAQSRGATHASELPYVFDTLPARYGKQVTDEDRRAAEQLHGYWAGFARHGRPAGEGLPAWPAHVPGDGRIMQFTAQGPRYGADPRKARLDLVEQSRQ